MINITYNNWNMVIEGHAGYEEPGKDIVCAAVSVLFQTLAHKLLVAQEDRMLEIECSMEGTPYINVKKVQGDYCFSLIEMWDMTVDGLKMIAEEYPDNVTIEQG